MIDGVTKKKMDRSIAVLEALLDFSGTTAERRLRILSVLSSSQDKCSVCEELQRVMQTKCKLHRHSLPRSFL